MPAWNSASCKSGLTTLLLILSVSSVLFHSVIAMNVERRNILPC
ncbi:hypothetical protein FHU10_1380 [Serratia fonticola]|uniref:Uncharacterized protein n=1 Tax=Serratia fonticola TaxID=47917 RepID=A0A559T2S8_SERFO|nr:hypothetical protein FHU09_1070 [Serratia fonticola]TQI99393.1 hypothetical protein FHU11_4981 [Serratia fonticola]TVZ68918.1 hypothetical protein FHU10_1380 [Serratia fonticola]